MNEPRDIDYLLDEVVTLPSLPSTVLNVLELLGDPDYSVKRVAEAISADPGITIKTLRIVNSAYYGLRQPVTSLEHAIVMLGDKVIRNLVISATVLETLQRGAASFFHHSVATAVCMRAMVQVRMPPIGLTPEEAFIHGLLHDVGKMILEEFLPDEYAQAEDRVRNEGIAMDAAERACIGADHAQVGARLAEKWRLSRELVNAIAGHHDLTACPDPRCRPLAAWLGVANYIVIASGYHTEPETWRPVPNEMWDAAEITSQDAPAFVEAFLESNPNAAIAQILEDGS